MEHTENDTQAECAHCENGGLCATAIPVFGTLSDELQASLSAHAVQTVRAKGSFLFQVGEAVDSVLIIHKGRVKLCKYDANGNEYILDILHDGDSIWEALFLEDPVFPYSAVCLSKVELCEIRKSEFIQLIAGRPDISMHLISLLSLRLRDANEKALLLSIYDPKVRLAGFLLDRDIRCVGPEIKLKLEDIAASIGLRPETVSRNMTRFVRANLIRRLGHGKIMVTDRAGLREIYEAGQAET